MGDKVTGVREFTKGAKHSIKFDAQNKSLETQVPSEQNLEGCEGIANYLSISR